MEGAVVHVCTPECQPGRCPRIYLGGPPPAVFAAIREMTYVQETGDPESGKGRVFFRTPRMETWLPLVGPYAFRELNRALDAVHNR